MDIRELIDLPFTELAKRADEMGIENIKNKHGDVIVAMLKKTFKQDPKADVTGYGILEILADGYGFLRSKNNNFRSSPIDVYISPSQIRRYSLSSGYEIEGKIKQPKNNERYFSIQKIMSINGVEVTDKMVKNYASFDNCTPLHPDRQIKMELGNGSQEDITTRFVDLISPLGFGQRALIVAPPKVGKTTLMQTMASSIAINHPSCHLIVLLVDERPEEVTEMRRTIRGDVIASTFDEAASSHIQAAEMTISYAKALAEQKKDVVILLDSITRLARAYNTATPTSGRILTGGVDANALQKPKRFFGAARNLEEGGSITIVATALVDTGSKMDEVIFQEFKGTGNCEICLDRRFAEKRCFPAININQSGTRREEMILAPDVINKAWVLRKMFHEMDDLASTEFLLDKLKSTKTNQEFFESMKK